MADDDWDMTDADAAAVSDEDSVEDATAEPAAEALGRRHAVLLAALAVGSIGVGFLFGRSIRERSTGVQSADFAPAAAPTVPGVPLGGDHFLVGQPAPAFQLTELATGKAAALSD